MVYDEGGYNEEDEDIEIVEEVEFIGMSTDPRAEKIDIEEDPERLFYEVDSIKEKRNKIITLHLYIEKAI